MEKEKKSASEKPKRGGKRPGAGHPLKYGEATTMYWCRIPESKYEKVDTLVKKFISKFEIKRIK